MQVIRQVAEGDFRPTVSADAIARIYATAYGAPGSYQGASLEPRQEAGEAAVKHFLATLERIGYFPPVIEAGALDA